MIIDYEKQILSVVSSDGQIHVEASSAQMRGGDVFMRAEVDRQTRELHLKLRDGSHITLEIGGDGAHDEPLAQRRVVYLDQNHWRTVDLAINTPGSLSRATKEAALALVDLARTKRIVLPLSSAHGFETARTSGPLRRSLATTMLELSRGWQMRHPIRVRNQELACAMTGERPVAKAVFTLDPEYFFAVKPTPPALHMVAPTWMAEQHRRVVGIQAIAAAFLENEAEDSTEARIMAEKWAATHERFSRALYDDSVSSERRRKSVALALLADLRIEIAESALASGLQAHAVAEWMQHRALHDLERMPYLARLHRVLFNRISNPREHWHRNDLVDAHYLSCAAAYADVVVSERRHAAALVAGPRSDGAAVFRTLGQAAAELAATVK